jgi:uncharacterized protein YfbU (UPF0304 family)
MVDKINNYSIFNIIKETKSRRYNMLNAIFEKTGLDLEPKEILYKAQEVLGVVCENVTTLKNEVEVKILEISEKFTK